MMPDFCFRIKVKNRTESPIVPSKKSMRKLISAISISLLSAFDPALSSDLDYSSMRSSNLKIASLPINLYNPDLSHFERTPDLAARYYSMASSFALKNDIDFVIPTGISHTSNEFSLRRLELLHNTKIDAERFKNPQIIFIDNRKVLQTLGITNVTPEANEIFLNYTKAIGADIVLNSAVYASDQVNKTDDFINFYNKTKIDENHIKLAEYNICTIDINSILRNDSLRKASKNMSPNTDAEIMKRVDSIIFNFAKINRIDLILNGTYSRNICNITNVTIKLIEDDFK